MHTQIEDEFIEEHFIQQANTEQLLNCFEDVLKIMNETFQNKNRDYGNSFQNSIDEFGLIASVIILKTKFDRFKTLSANFTTPNYESMEDNLLDLANYCILTYLKIKEKTHVASDEF